ncbi:hypothetical protein [Massilia timonae]|uniref:Uncharacterized protein n=1 Tax=Massilia timonae TaxID=47229 RepID=A0A1S2N5E5_9BURK|nr:hypothetical protein [Massilia timonae]OIJ40040.1 hypothetical protein LO55_5070 [Massilia timonae]
MSITERQLELLHHTLGVHPERRESHRNYFVAGPGHHDQQDLEALEAVGLMERGRTPAFLDKGDVVFQCTEAGRAYAIDNLPPPPKYSRYEEYLRSECSEGFAWWLGIRVPRLEMDFQWGKPTQYRYTRRDGYEWVDVRGEWKSTKKEAKASYKAALKKHQDEQRAWRKLNTEPA